MPPLAAAGTRIPLPAGPRVGRAGLPAALLPVWAAGVGVRVGETRLLEGVNLTIGPGERLLLTGPSGGGKTTLARTLTGMIPQAFPGQRQGEVQVYGQDPAEQPLWETAQHLALVFQRPASQLFNFTVWDELLFGPLNLGLDTAEAEARAQWALRALGLEGFEGRNPRTLSGGELQRLALAAVLAMRPRALILDEPTAHLDRAGRASLMEALARLNGEDGLAVVVIEHRTRAWIPFAQRCLHLAGGRLAAAPPVDQQPRGAGQGDTCGPGLGTRRVTSPPAGAKALDPWGLPAPLLTPPACQGTGGRLLLRLEGGTIASRPTWVRGAPRRVLLREVHLEIRAGELILLTGENGSGKSTLARVLAGLERPASGRLHRSTRPLLLFQDPADQLFGETVGEELVLALRAHRGRRAGRGDLVQRLLQDAGLAGREAQPVGSLSTGEQRRLALAALVAAAGTGPEEPLFILDEPTAGQDDGHLAALVRMMERLNKELGAALLVISHDERLIGGWPGRRLHIHGDRLVEGPPPGEEGVD